MNLINMRKKENLIFQPVSVIAVLLAGIFLALPEEAAQGCADGIELCLNAAVPSLFPMMFAAVFAAESGLTARLGRLMSPVTAFLFGLPQAGGAVAASLAGGFPAGAKTVSRMYEKGEISRNEAEQMVLFCFAAGPAFLIGGVGGIYGSSSVGWCLLVIQIISVTILGVLSGLLFRRTKAEFQPERTDKVRMPEKFSRCMTGAVSQTASVMLNICLYIILFSILRAAADAVGLPDIISKMLVWLGIREQTAQAVFPVMLEVTSGCAAAAEAGLPVTAFAVGFGGFAVHMQVMAIAENTGIKYIRFLAMRLAQGILCALMMQIYILTAPEKAVAALALPGAQPSFSQTPAGAVVLIVMSFMWLMCLPDFRKHSLPAENF